MRQRGFTLIELMIVIAILGILAAVVIPAYQEYRGKNRTDSSGMVVPDKPASDTRCERGIVTRNGDAVKRANGTLIEC